MWRFVPPYRLNTCLDGDRSKILGTTPNCPKNTRPISPSPVRQNGILGFHAQLLWISERAKWLGSLILQWKMPLRKVPANIYIRHKAGKGKELQKQRLWSRKGLELRLSRLILRGKCMNQWSLFTNKNKRAFQQRSPIWTGKEKESATSPHFCFKQLQTSITLPVNAGTSFISYYLPLCDVVVSVRISQ